MEKRQAMRCYIAKHARWLLENFVSMMTAHEKEGIMYE